MCGGRTRGVSIARGWVGGFGVGWCCLLCRGRGHHKNVFLVPCFLDSGRRGSPPPPFLVFSLSLNLFLPVHHLSRRSLTLFTSDSCSFLFTAVYLLCGEMEDGALAGAPSSRRGRKWAAKPKMDDWMILFFMIFFGFVTACRLFPPGSWHLFLCQYLVRWRS